jgi:hypothetical protein
MYRHIYLFLLLLLAAALINSCKNKTTETDAQYTVGIFPSGKGSNWTYIIYDTLRNRTDTMSITIVDELSFPPHDKKQTWQFVKNSIADTEYVFLVDDTVTFYTDYWSSGPTDVKYIFPLTIGHGWKSANDTFYVKSVDQILMPGDTVKSAYRITRNSNGLFRQLYETIWFVPYLGMIQKDKDEFYKGQSANEKWELINYHLVPE